MCASAHQVRDWGNRRPVARRFLVIRRRESYNGVAGLGLHPLIRKACEPIRHYFMRHRLWDQIIAACDVLAPTSHTTREAATNLSRPPASADTEATGSTDSTLNDVCTVSTTSLLQ